MVAAEPAAEPVAEPDIAHLAAPEPEPAAPNETLRDIIIADGSGLTLDSDVVDAPSIGPKTAARLYAVGINTIRDLLGTDPVKTAEDLDARHITADTVLDWQDQTAMKMAVPSLRVHDVQLLVGAGFRSVDEVASARAGDLLKAAMAHFEKPETRRIIKHSNAPDATEVDHWIGLAKEAI
jgi:hypothetical protein